MKTYCECCGEEIEDVDVEQCSLCGQDGLCALCTEPDVHDCDGLAEMEMHQELEEHEEEEVD